MTDNKKRNKAQWKRMSLKGNKVWVQIGHDGKFILKNNKVLIKYNLEQDYEYLVKKDNLKHEKYAVPSKKNTLKKNQTKKIKDSPKDSPDKNNTSNTEKSIIIYTDGASSGNPGPAGIGALLIFGRHKKEISESIGFATNNIAELTAIKKALLNLKRLDIPVCIYTDSSYSLGVLTKNWKSKKNIELIESIKKIIRKFKDLKIIKIKGHAGIKGNEIADSLATLAIKK